MAGIDTIDVMATQVSSPKLGPHIRVLFPNKTTLLLSWNSHRGGDFSGGDAVITEEAQPRRPARDTFV
jgi:hypothetical protein